MSMFNQDPVSKYDINLYNLAGSPDHGRNLEPSEAYLLKVPAKLRTTNHRLVYLTQIEHEMTRYDWAMSVRQDDSRFQESQDELLRGDLNSQFGEQGTVFADFLAEAYRVVGQEKENEHGHLIKVAHQIKVIQSYKDIARSIRSMTITGEYTTTTEQSQLETHLKTENGRLERLLTQSEGAIDALRQVRIDIRKEDVEGLRGSVANLLEQLSELHFGLLSAGWGHLKGTGPVDQVTARGDRAVAKLGALFTALINIIALMLTSSGRKLGERPQENEAI